MSTLGPPYHSSDDRAPVTYGRMAFLTELARLVPHVLLDLWSEVLPHLRELGDAEDLTLELALLPHAEDDAGSEAGPAAAFMPELAPLRRAIRAWGRRHRLLEVWDDDDQWMWQTLQYTVQGWTGHDDESEYLRWRFPPIPSQVVGESGDEDLDLIVLQDGAWELPDELEVFQVPGWVPQVESIKEFRGRIETEWRAYLERARAAMKDGNLQRTHVKPQLTEHLQWLARYHVLYQSAGEIAFEDFGGTGEERTVSKAVRRTAKLIGLKLRRPKPGGRPKKKKP
jgi:hypothetical protein